MVVENQAVIKKPTPIFKNYDTDENENKIPHPLDIATANYFRIIGTNGGVLFKVGKQGFVANEIGGVTKVTSLPDDNWLIVAAMQSQVGFMFSPKMYTKKEFFNNIINNMPEKLGVSEVPHYPKIDDFFYKTCKTVKNTLGKTPLIDKLIDIWEPASAFDKNFLRVALLTPFWGGEPGGRPAIVIESETSDGGDGRGYGKTAFCQVVSDLAGGSITGGNIHSIDKLRDRIINAARPESRIILLDNIKSAHIQNPELEEMITAYFLQGRKLYIGDAAIKNYFTWFLTINGLGMCADMASRSMIIRINKFTHNVDYYTYVRDIIVNHRAELVGEVIGVLGTPSKSVGPYCRFRDWQDQVFNKVCGPEDAQELLRRQHETQGIEEEREEIADYIEETISRYWLNQTALDVEKNIIVIPKGVLHSWISASKMLNTKSVKGTTMKIKDIKIDALHEIRTSKGRFWVYDKFKKRAMIDTWVKIKGHSPEREGSHCEAIKQFTEL